MFCFVWQGKKVYFYKGVISTLWSLWVLTRKTCHCCCLVTSVVSDSVQPHKTAAHQAPPSMGVSRQEYWSGVLLPSLWLWRATTKTEDLACWARESGNEREDHKIKQPGREDDEDTNAWRIWGLSCANIWGETLLVNWNFQATKCDLFHGRHHFPNPILLSGLLV